MGWPPRFSVAFSRLRTIHSRPICATEHTAACLDATRRRCSAGGLEAHRIFTRHHTRRRPARPRNTTACDIVCCVNTVSSVGSTTRFGRDRRAVQHASAGADSTPTSTVRQTGQVAVLLRCSLTTARLLGHNHTASRCGRCRWVPMCQCTRPRSSQHRRKPHGLADTARQVRSSDQGRLPNH
jgi:hypothetical protein